MSLLGGGDEAETISQSAEGASRLDKLWNMCYHIVLSVPERREQASLVRFAHLYGLHEEVMPIENVDDSDKEPGDSRRPIEGK
jgi:hypothetical protein